VHWRTYMTITRRELLGYIMRQQVKRAITTNGIARRKLRQILENDIGPQLRALYLAQVGNELGANLDALREMQLIVNGNLPVIPDDVMDEIESLLTGVEQ